MALMPQPQPLPLGRRALVRASLHLLCTLLCLAAPGSGGGAPTHCCFVFGCSADHTALLGQGTTRAALSAWLADEGNVTVPASDFAFRQLPTVGSVVCFGPPAAAAAACAPQSRLGKTVSTGLTFFSFRKGDGTTMMLRPHPRTLRGTSSPADPGLMYGDMLATDRPEASNYVSSGAAAGIIFGVLLGVLLLSSACIVALHSPKCPGFGRRKAGKAGSAHERIQDEDFARGGGSFQVDNPLFSGT